MVRLGVLVRLAGLELRLRLELADEGAGDGREGCTERVELLLGLEVMPPRERVMGLLTLGVLRRGVGVDVTRLVLDGCAELLVRVGLVEDLDCEGWLVTCELVDRLFDNVPRDRLGFVFATGEGVLVVGLLLAARLLVLVGIGRGFRTPGCPETAV